MSSTPEELLHAEVASLRVEVIRLAEEAGKLRGTLAAFITRDEVVERVEKRVRDVETYVQEHKRDVLKQRRKATRIYAAALAVWAALVVLAHEAHIHYGDSHVPRLDRLEQQHAEEPEE